MAVETKPDMVPALTNLTTVLIALDRIDEAVETGRKAVSLAPTFGLARNNLAVALYNKGDKAGALEQAMKARAAGHAVSDDFLAKLGAKT
jgi:Flp pilus assembly protein TadD